MRLLAESSSDNIYQFSARSIDGREVSMGEYQGRVCLVVNVASRWGKTRVNYTQLVQLYDKYNKVSSDLSN